MPLFAKATLGFAAACDKTPGDFVAWGGNLMKITKVCLEGKDAPYFHLEPIGGGQYISVSWQLCGDAVPFGEQWVPPSF